MPPLGSVMGFKPVEYGGDVGVCVLKRSQAARWRRVWRQTRRRQAREESGNDEDPPQKKNRMDWI